MQSNGNKIIILDKKKNDPITKPSNHFLLYLPE